MTAGKRIIVNTLAQYSKAIINICLSLYSTRLILEALDISDYGIYSVVAGVVGILNYLTNSLVVTTQRYISYYCGKGDTEHLKILFASSLTIHAVIAAVFFLALFLAGNAIIDGFLNIPAERLSAARFVYDVTLLMFILTIATSPFKALLTAHENIVYISIIEVADGILKFALAIVLSMVSSDKLEFYSIMLLVILCLNFTAFTSYCFFHYKESHVLHINKYINMGCIRQLTNFTSWTTFGLLAGICQNQGTAIIVNKFFGTVMNAAFGLALQVNGAIRFVSTSLLNAMNPQIMKAEGNGDRSGMISLAEKESKFSTALMSIISIPVIIEMPAIMSFWLKETPPHTVMFTSALMIAFIIDQLTLGLHAANQATGKIRNYTIATTLPKMLLPPIMWTMLAYDASVDTIMIVYVVVELAVAIFRIPYMQRTIGLDVRHYLLSVIVPIVPLVISIIVVCLLVVNSFTLGTNRLFITLPCGFAAGAISMWFATLTSAERLFAKQLIKERRKK